MPLYQTESRKTGRPKNRTAVNYSQNYAFTNSFESPKIWIPVRENRIIPVFSWFSDKISRGFPTIKKFKNRRKFPFCGFLRKFFRFFYSAFCPSGSGTRSIVPGPCGGGSWSGSVTTLSMYLALISSAVDPSSAGSLGETTTSCLS